MQLPPRRSAEAPEAAQSMPAHRDRLGGLRAALCGLFPAAPAAAEPLAWRSRVLVAAAEVAAVLIGAAALLLRVSGLRAWDSVYAEDYYLYLPQALEHPWDLFILWDGYVNLVPRLIAQFVTYLPLAEAAKGFAVFGAITAALCALFIFHASDGHIRSLPLRVLLGVSVVLLSIAPMEIADSGVDTLWYLLPAAFWAVLWRPRTYAGMAVAAVVVFLAGASTILVFLFVPLLALRVFALRRVRDHLVTAGWLAGCLVQARYAIEPALSGQNRLAGYGGPAFGRSDPLGKSLAFYFHDVVLRSVGWHLSWWFESHTTEDWATLIVSVALAAALGVVIYTQPGARPFTVAAVATGFIVTLFCVYIDPWDAVYPVTLRSEVASRYSVLPILLIEAVFIVGADHALRGRRGSRPQREPGQRHPLLTARPMLAAILLAAFLAGNWAADFRYYGIRSGRPNTIKWAPVVAEWQHDCAVSRTGDIALLISGHHYLLSCRHLGFSSPLARQG